jgi:hypothetical protein
MSDRITSTVQSIEQSSSVSRDGHTHNFENAYAQIAKLQNEDGGAQSQRFKQDMVSANKQLHDEGILPNLQIVGVDENQHSLITRDIADNRTVVQNAGSVNDFGSLGSGSNPQEAPAGFLASTMGLDVTRNPDNSYNVQNPFDNPQDATTSILNTVFKGMMGGDNNTPSSDENGDRDPNASESGTPFGMNSLEAQSWKGFADEEPDEN